MVKWQAVRATLYTVLVSPDDDRRLMGYYPTLAGPRRKRAWRESIPSRASSWTASRSCASSWTDLKHGKFEHHRRSGGRSHHRAAARRGDADCGLAAAPRGAGLRSPTPRRAPSPCRSSSTADTTRDTPPRLPWPPRPTRTAATTSTTSTISRASTTPRPWRGRVQPAPAAPVPEDEIGHSIDYGEYVRQPRLRRAARRHPPPRPPRSRGPFAHRRGRGWRGSRSRRYGRRGHGRRDAAAPPSPAAPTAAPGPAAHGRRNRRVRRRAANRNPMPAGAAVRPPHRHHEQPRVRPRVSARLLIGRESKNDIAVRQ